jgi:hypothetical protein
MQTQSQPKHDSEPAVYHSVVVVGETYENQCMTENTDSNDSMIGQSNVSDSRPARKE